jgi:hypothetical protein
MISMEECRESAHMLATDRLITSHTRDERWASFLHTSKSLGLRLTKSVANGLQAASHYARGMQSISSRIRM